MENKKNSMKGSRKNRKVKGRIKNKTIGIYKINFYALVNKSVKDF